MSKVPESVRKELATLAQDERMIAFWSQVTGMPRADLPIRRVEMPATWLKDERYASVQFSTGALRALDGVWRVNLSS